MEEETLSNQITELRKICEKLKLNLFLLEIPIEEVISRLDEESSSAYSLEDCI